MARRRGRRRGAKSNPGNRLALGFAVRFLGLVLLLSATARLDLVLADGAASRALTHGSASVAAGTLSLFGAEVVRNGNVLIYRSAAFKIIDECTGIDVMGLLLAAMLAFPSTWRHRAIGIALGIPILLVLNLIRIITLVLVGAASMTALDYGHVYVWPVIILTVALGLWLQWAKLATVEPGRLA